MAEPLQNTATIGAPTERETVSERRPEHPELRIYGHSALFYWWPIWVVGYILAAITYLGGDEYQIGSSMAWIHPSKGLAVIYGLTLFLVILITSVIVRGLASVIVILSVMFITLLFTYLDWWEHILPWFGKRLTVHINLGFYVAFSTLLFVAWALTVFVFDRLRFWRITPGQITLEHLIGASAKSYDTDNLKLEKLRDDFFRHWILGFGSGDIHVQPLAIGGDREDIHIHNVFFVGSKVHAIQHMIATEPDKFSHVTVK
jgi:hypothetical protein